MKQEAIEYGYIPRRVFPLINRNNPAPVSNQLQAAISEGRVGPDMSAQIFQDSLKAAWAESLHFSKTSPAPLAASHKEYAKFYRQASTDRDLQILIAKMKIDEMIQKQAKALRSGQLLEAPRLAQAAMRWAEVAQSLRSFNAKPILRIGGR